MRSQNGTGPMGSICPMCFQMQEQGCAPSGERLETELDKTEILIHYPTQLHTLATPLTLSIYYSLLILRQDLHFYTYKSYHKCSVFIMHIWIFSSAKKYLLTVWLVLCLFGIGWSRYRAHLWLGKAVSENVLKGVGTVQSGHRGEVRPIKPQTSTNQMVVSFWPNWKIISPLPNHTLTLTLTLVLLEAVLHLTLTSNRDQEKMWINFQRYSDNVKDNVSLPCATGPKLLNYTVPQTSII